MELTWARRHAEKQIFSNNDFLTKVGREYQIETIFQVQQSYIRNMPDAFQGLVRKMIQQDATDCIFCRLWNNVVRHALTNGEGL